MAEKGNATPAPQKMSSLKIPNFCPKSMSGTKKNRLFSVENFGLCGGRFVDNFERRSE
jgi:hypothetical protein